MVTKNPPLFSHSGFSICFRTLPPPPGGSHPPVFASLHSPHDLPTDRNRYHGEVLGGLDLGGRFHRDLAKSSFFVNGGTWGDPFAYLHRFSHNHPRSTPLKGPPRSSFTWATAPFTKRPRVPATGLTRADTSK